MSKIVDTIRKLLALARDKGATEAEAAAAMAKASKLMLEHNISDLPDDPDELVVIEGAWSGWVPDWTRAAAWSSAELFGCVHVVTRSGNKIAHRYVGRPENVEACVEMTAYLCGQIEQYYKDHLSNYGGALGKRGRAELRATFKQAAAAKLSLRVREIVKFNRQSTGSTALVVVDQAKARAEDMTSHLKTTKTKPPKLGMGTLAGIAAADSIKIRDEVK